jgi:hypothetical protein
LTNEIQSSTVTRQPNVQTPLHSGLHGPGHDISWSYSNPRIVVYFLSFNIYLIEHSFFFDSLFLNVSLILVSSPSFPYAFLYFFEIPPSYLWGLAQLVEALRYKLEGRGFDSRWCQ